MSQPILSIAERKGCTESKTTVNLLPCRIDHDGPVNPVTPFWTPQKEESTFVITPTKDEFYANSTRGLGGSSVAYFRGRRLQGRTVKLPDEYRGVLLEREEKLEDKDALNELTDVVNVDEDEGSETEKMRTVGEYDEVVIWGHETIADATDDPYVRSIEEWLHLSDQVCMTGSNLAETSHLIYEWALQIHSFPGVNKKEGK